MKWAEDNIFNAHAYFYAEKIAYLPYTMYYYRNNPQGVTKKFDDNFENHVAVVNERLSDCLHELYPGDKEAEEQYKYNRVICLLLDGIRLKFFNSNNKRPAGIRKKEFFDFIDTEPYKSAVDGFKFNNLDRSGWIVLMALVKKRSFIGLNILHHNTFLYNSVMGVARRIASAKKKLQSK